jgi:acetoin utilization deacetylase AcuC-like enzyme
MANISTQEWKKVASMVRTRTVVQTRTHAQKYFQKVTKTLGCVGICGSDDDGEASACSDIKRGMSLSSKKGRRSFLGSSPDLSAGYPSEISSSMTIAYNPTSSVIKPSALTYGNTPTVKDHFHSSREYMIDEDSIGRDSLVLSELMNMTPNTSGVQSGNSGSLLGLSIPLPPPPFLSLPNREALGFPQPSPAACGKRKHAELQAAQMLAASSVFEIDATDAFLMVKEDSSVGHKRPTGLTLTISNPEVSSDNGGAFFGPPPDSTPGTPWAKDLKALEARGCKTQQSAVPVITPSEQRNFLTKVRLLVQVADLSGLREILNAAEFSAQSFLTSNSGAIGDPASLVSVSNMMTAFTTPLPPDFGGIPRTGSPRAGGSNVISFRKTPGTSLVARSLNRSDKREKSVLMEAISLLDEVHDEAVVCELLSLLLVHGASASLTDSKNNTALHFAATKGLESVGRLLLNKGCPVNLQNSDGDAATHIAAQHGYGAFLEMLVDLGANFHLRNQHALCALDLAGHLSQVPGERAIIRRLMLAKEPRLRTLILYHDDCLAHTTCRSTDWEGPDRLVDIMKRLRDRQEFPEFELEISDQFEKASVVLLNRAHSPEYITFVNDLSTQLNADNSGALGECDFKAPLAMPFTPQIQRFVLNKTLEELKSSEICDTSFSPGTLSSARRAAGAVAHAVDCVLLGRNRNVFCVVRPPGHHAGYNGLLDGGYSCGFCIFNSVAAGALHALEEHNCERVAIIDLDIHHGKLLFCHRDLSQLILLVGNGTEDIVRRYPHPSRLFFFSLHLYDKEAQVQTSTGSVPGFQFYPGSGAADDTVCGSII